MRWWRHTELKWPLIDSVCSNCSLQAAYLNVWRKMHLGTNKLFGGCFYPNCLPLQWVQLFLAQLSPLGITPPHSDSVRALFYPPGNKPTPQWQCLNPSDTQNWFRKCCEDPLHSEGAVTWTVCCVTAHICGLEVHVSERFAGRRHSATWSAAMRDTLWGHQWSGESRRLPPSWLGFNWVAHVPRMWR